MTFEDRLIDNELEDAIYLTEEYYDDAAIGYSEDGRIIYDYDKLIDALVGTGM